MTKVEVKYTSSHGSSASLKPGWRVVKFGDVVHQCKESVDRDNNPFERYIEGGHMNSEDIHIRRWGDFGEDYVGPAFHRIFRKGQVLYGSRRTYLKKVAVAEFDGITANTTFVLETKSQSVFLQELLPFLMLTDAFTEHSIRESKGSTNPYINWPDIAKYEFLLPPIEEQKCIAEILWAADEAVASHQEALRRCKVLIQYEFENTLEALSCPELVLPKVLSGSPESGCSAPPVPYETGHWVLSLAALSANGYCRDNLKSVNKTGKMLTARLHKGDFLISRSNTVEMVGFVGIFDEDREDVSFPDTMMRLPVNREKLLPEYLELVLLSNRGRKHMAKTASGTSNSMKKINRKTLNEFKFPVPSIEAQKEIISIFSGYKKHCSILAKHLCCLRKLLFSLINKEVGTPYVYDNTICQKLTNIAHNSASRSIINYEKSNQEMKLKD
ncbi:MAG: restriction endonuclease subunit S, partial [bacterium]|nr:restriction endonuclease subunit S [bacterium]